MLRKPEELILAALGLIWVASTFFLCRRLGMDFVYCLQIAGATLLWVIVLFVLWQRGKTRLIWPLFCGLLVACWWPVLDWIALPQLTPVTGSDLIILQRPWYASWTFKILLALAAVSAGYAWLFVRRGKKAGSV